VPGISVHPIGPQQLEFALLRDGSGYLVGSLDEVEKLTKGLEKLVERGRHDGVVDITDQRLSWLWISVTDAHKTSGVAKRTIVWAINNGDLKGADKLGPGGAWRFPKAAFEAWMQNRRKPGPKPKAR